MRRKRSGSWLKLFIQNVIWIMLFKINTNKSNKSQFFPLFFFSSSSSKIIWFYEFKTNIYIYIYGLFDDKRLNSWFVHVCVHKEIHCRASRSMSQLTFAYDPHLTYLHDNRLSEPSVTRSPRSFSPASLLTSLHYKFIHIYKY